MAYINIENRTYQQLAPWQKRLIHFSQNALTKFIYQIIFLADLYGLFCVLEKINFKMPIVYLNSISLILPFCLVYFCVMQVGWLFSHYAIVNKKENKAIYFKLIYIWLALVIITITISVVLSICLNNFSTKLLYINLCFFVNCFGYELAVLILYTESKRRITINVVNKIVGKRLLFLGLAIVITSFIYAVYPYLSFGMATIFTFVIMCTIAIFSLSIFVPLIKQNIKYCNNKQDDSFTENMSKHLHLFFNGKYAHRCYLGSLEIIIYCYSVNLLSDLLDTFRNNVNVFINMCTTSINEVITKINFQIIGYSLVGLVMIGLCYFDYAYLHKQNSN